jgi:glycosyltransferase involved in cell wall biosynthesis
MKVSLIILTFNERNCLDAVIPRIPHDAVDEILVVDGGSTDGTVEYFRERNIRVIGQTERGRGAAFFVAAKEATGDTLIFFSPDGNENPDDIPKFRDHLLAGADMVIASRMMKGAFNEEDVSWFRPRKWANQFFNALSNIFFRRSGQWVTDSINGFRAVTKKAFAEMKPDSTGFSIEYQMTIKAFKKRLRIVEFPTHEGSRIAGKTKAPSVRTGLHFIYLLLCELVS